MDATCPVCGEAVDPATAIACTDCSSPHHPDCWEYQGGCSMFGCGSQESLDFAAIKAQLASRGELTIDERTRAPVPWRGRAKGLVRYVKTHAVDLPGTMAAGVGGALLSIAAYHLIHPPAGPDGRLYTAIFLTGSLYGVLAPFLAPAQLRHPGKTAGASMVLFGLLYTLGEYLHVTDWAAMMLVVPLFFLSFLFASSAAELVAGLRTAVGERLGRLGAPVRVALTWIFAVGLMVGTVGFDRGGSLPSARILREIALWGLLAAGTVGPALEQGKRHLHARLPESTD